MLNPEIHIPVEDISRQYNGIKDEIAQAINQANPAGPEQGQLQPTTFEKAYADYCQSPFCLGVVNSAETINLALEVCEVKYRDEVILPPNSYAAAAYTIAFKGAIPVFVDVLPESFNLNPEKIEAAITPRTKAIMPIHMYGLPVEMNDILEIARRRGLKVIEDVAHAPGALYHGRKTGSLGDLACHSFYPRKVLGGHGDGGALTLRDESLYERAQQFLYFGRVKEIQSETPMFEHGLDLVQMAILETKLRHLDEWIDARRRIAAIYDEILAEQPLITPQAPAAMRHVYYQYTVRTPRRDELLKHLAGRGIGSQVMYPIEAPYQPAYQHLGYQPGDFPTADRLVGEILCLPMFPELTDDEVYEVCGAICDFFES
jgi:dTDP-4-amino-4,6-dideoxygalactose transaminase